MHWKPNTHGKKPLLFVWIGEVFLAKIFLKCPKMCESCLYSCLQYVNIDCTVYGKWSWRQSSILCVMILKWNVLFVNVKSQDPNTTQIVMTSYDKLLTSKVTIFQKGVTMNFSVTSKMHLTSWGGWYSKDMTFVIPTKDMNDIAIVVQIHLRRNWLLVLLFLQQNPPSSTTTRIIPKRRDPSETKMTMTWWHKSLVIILPREKKKDSDFILLVTYWKCERNGSIWTRNSMDQVQNESHAISSRLWFYCSVVKHTFKSE